MPQLTNEDYGKLVKVTHRYKKSHIIRYTPYHRHHPEKTTANSWTYWNRVPYRTDGIFLGIRYLREGTRHLENEVGYYFECIGSFKAALVSPGARRNPIYVPLDAVMLLGKEDCNV